MKNKFLIGASALLIGGAVMLTLLTPVAAPAQGVVGGAANGADEGNRRAGPVGAVVGGVVGAVTGGVDGLLGVDQRPRFHEYVEREHHNSYHYSHELVVGEALPSDGVEYYEVPREYGAAAYRYTVVNDHTVLVDPRTRQIVQILD